MRYQLYTEIFSYLDSYVSGQRTAKDKLATLGYLYGNRCHALYSGVRLESLPRLNMFLTGPTGTGKTLLVETMSKCMDIPFIRIDCSSLSQVGWEGVSIDNQLIRFSSILGEEGFGVIMLDEFDKLGYQCKSSSGSVPSLGIQYNLLDLIDGKYAHPKVLPSINNCLILCSGAFSSVREKHNEDKQKQAMGFIADETQKRVIKYRDIMIEGGIIPELVGRMVDVIETEPLNEDQIREVILNKKGTAYKKYQNLMLGMEFTDEDVDTLVKETVGSEYGLRGLDASVFNIVHKKLMDQIHANGELFDIAGKEMEFERMLDDNGEVL
jgi:ATP-dependent Clp protease ATP-binding subunit ClpX